MSFTTPTSLSAGTYPTAAELNAYRAGILWAVGGGSGNKAQFRAHLVTNQSIATATETVIKCDTVDEDTDSAYSASTGLWTCVQAGLYSVAGYVNWTANTTGVRAGHILTTGAPASVYLSITAPAVGFTTGPIPLAMITRLSVGSTVQLNGYQTSGGALSASGCHLNIVQIGL